MIKIGILAPYAHLPIFPYSLIPTFPSSSLIPLFPSIHPFLPSLPSLPFILPCFLCPSALFPSSTNVPGIFSESHLPSGWQDTLRGHLSTKLNVVMNKVDIAPLKWYVTERGREGEDGG